MIISSLSRRGLCAGTLLIVAVNLRAAVLYVDANSANPAAPYSSWATAAKVIQDAIDAAAIGDTVLVTNGIYATGGRTAGTSALTNRVAVDRPLTLQSVNGPKVTVIQGYQVPGITNGPGAIRCVYLGSNAVLSGFTLTNGANWNDGSAWDAGMGGGVRGEGAWSGARVTNCMLIGNSSLESGGGAYGVRLVNCLLIKNTVQSGVEAFISGGGGAYQCMLENCTVVFNSAGRDGGGIAMSPARNCIIYYNTVAATQWGSPNYWWYKDFSVPYSCCTAPALEPYYAALRNITNEPRFVSLAGGDFHLQPNSPCINAGDNASVSAATDLDGNPRTVGGTVDIGVYEFQSPASTLSYAWLQQFGLPTDGSVDNADLDGDRHTNWQEWKAGTIPTNNLSVLRMLNPATNASGLNVSWQSVTDRTYFLERATSLGSSPAFLPLRSNLTGQAGTTSFTDTNAIGSGPVFYRVGVQE